MKEKKNRQRRDSNSRTLTGNRLAVYRLNHSATLSMIKEGNKQFITADIDDVLK